MVPWEFKLSRDEVVSLHGQLINRCEVLFLKQSQRRRVYAVGIMMDAVEVYVISRSFNVQRTGLLPLSIDSHSPGLRLVASVLQASLEQLDFWSPQLLPGTRLGSYTIRHADLIKQGSAPRGENPDTLVYRVAVDGLEEPAVLKLRQESNDPNEVMHPVLHGAATLSAF